MGTHTYYTHRQAKLLLGIDGKTLNKWLEAANIEMQPDPKDTRIKRIARTQLQRLATLHSVELPDDEEALLDDLEHARSLNSLTLEVERLEQSLEQRFEQMQQTLMEAMEQRLTQESEHVLAELGALIQKQLPQTLSEQVNTILTAAQEELQLFLEKQITALGKELQSGRAGKLVTSAAVPHKAPEERTSSTIPTSETQSRPVEPNKPVSSTTSKVQRYERPSNKKDATQDNHTWTRDELFGEGWIDPEEGPLVSRARMCKAHGIPETNLRRDIEKRQIVGIVDKRFLFEGVWRTGGFNAAQMRRIWEEYHDMTWFNACEICLANQHAEEEVPQ